MFNKFQSLASLPAAWIFERLKRSSIGRLALLLLLTALAGGVVWVVNTQRYGCGNGPREQLCVLDGPMRAP